MIFSRDLTCKSERNGLLDTDCMQLCKSIYEWEKRDVKTKLVYIYSQILSSKGRKTPDLEIIKPIDLVAPLIQAIWHENATTQTSPTLAMEKLYVFMTFMPVTIDIEINHQDEDEAFNLLMIANNWAAHGFSIHSKAHSEAFENVSVPYNVFGEEPYSMYPSMIFYYLYGDKAWTFEYRLDAIPSFQYLAVSYRQRSESSIKLNEMLTSVFSIIREPFRMDACWIDYLCVTSMPVYTDYNLFHMADAYLKARRTLILLVDPSLDIVLSLPKDWKIWGDNIWSLVEMLLSAKLIFSCSTNFFLDITKDDAFVRAYGKDERYFWLADHFEKNKTLSDESLWPALMSAIWEKGHQMGGELLLLEPTRLTKAQYFPKYPAERVYAFMALIPVRIFPNKEESEKAALERLLKANGKDVAKFRGTLHKWCDDNLKVDKDSHSSYLRRILDDFSQ